jgi:hypothetical protein
MHPRPPSTKDDRAQQLRALRDNYNIVRSSSPFADNALRCKLEKECLEQYDHLMRLKQHSAAQEAVHLAALIMDLDL